MNFYVFVNASGNKLTNCFASVRCGGNFSFWFCILGGRLRLGGYMSPVSFLFAIYMDVGY